MSQRATLGAQRSSFDVPYISDAPTLVGTARERFLTGTIKLGKIQERAVTTSGVKRSRVYHLVTGATHALDLPSILVGHSMAEYDRILPLIPRKTSMARPTILATIALINASRKLGVVFYRNKLLEYLGIRGKAFNRIILRIMSLNNHAIVSIVQGSDVQRIVGRVVSTVSTSLNTSGTDITRLAYDIYRIMASHVIGMREDSKVAVISYVLLKKLWPDFACLSHLATHLHCRISSIYNALTRIFERMGLGGKKRLSHRNITRHFDTLIERGKSLYNGRD